MTQVSRRHLLAGAAGAAAVYGAATAHAATTSDLNICAAPKFDESFDLVVIGSGGAGLSSAVMAKQQGVKRILVLEKMAFLGGNTAISGGGFNSYDPPRQQAQGIKDSPELHFENTYDGGDRRANPELVHAMTENSYAAIQWLESIGMKFKPNVYQIYGGLYPRCHAPYGSLGSDYIKVLKAQCDKLGIEIRTNSRVVRVLRESPLEGKVTGVEYVDKSGKKHVIEATLSVVAAAGGFGANPQMRALHDPRMLNLTTTNQPGATGDLIPLLQDIGAEVTGMDFIQCNPGCPPGRSHRIIMHLIVRNFIMVDLSGKRFVAEDSRRDVIRDAVLSLPKQTAFSIIDQNGFDETNPGHQAGILKGFETGDAWKADTIEELAAKMKVDPAVLKKTIDDFNAGVDAQRDALGKAPIHGTNRLGGNAICDIFTFGRLTGIAVAKGE